MSKPKSLVTGACGFIGSHVVEDAVAAGHEVVATDLPSAWEKDDRKRGLFPSVARSLASHHQAADVTKDGGWDELTSDLDYVFHVASVFNYSTPWHVYKRVNVDGTRSLLERVLKNSPNLKRFILWGAGGVYGKPEYHDGPFTEDMPTSPTNDYLRSKWFQEHLTMKFCEEHGISWTILRPTTVYGPRQVYAFGELLMKNARTNPLVIPASMTTHVPMVHVKDVSGAGVYLASAEKGEGIFNCNDDTDITTVELMQVMADWGGHRLIKIPVVTPRMLKEVAFTAASVFGVLEQLIPGFKTPVEKPVTEYLDCDFRYDNTRLKESGYTFRYPEARVGVPDTIDWYVREGWI